MTISRAEKHFSDLQFTTTPIESTLAPLQPCVRMESDQQAPTLWSSQFQVPILDMTTAVKKGQILHGRQQCYTVLRKVLLLSIPFQRVYYDLYFCHFNSILEGALTYIFQHLARFEVQHTRKQLKVAKLTQRLHNAYTNKEDTGQPPSLTSLDPVQL